MKISGGMKEDGVVVGNAFNKYSSKNPIVQWIMRGFHDALDEFVHKAAPKSIHEIGCGEGYWVIRWNKEFLESKGSDFSSQVIEFAKYNAIESGLSPGIFRQRSIYDLDSNTDKADLIVCCEVLEHLENPKNALFVMQRIVEKHLILSVPREPLWRSLNLIRGKYISSLGNTPGHIHHWSQSEFVNLVSAYFDIVEVKKPLPWLMLLCRSKS
jgi:2-polyprenyl-3-methyl-5-hydroxy-6-metoxy-1,4-benzoquinol methylase